MSMQHPLPRSIQLCFPFQVNTSGRSTPAQHSSVERVLYIFGCTQEGCGQLDGSWRAFSYHISHCAPGLSAPADTPSNDGTLNEAVSSSQQLDWSARDTAESQGPSSTSLQPTSMPNSLEDWGLDRPGWLDEPCAADTADADASPSLEQLTTALEGLTTTSGPATKVLLQTIRIVRECGSPCHCCLTVRNVWDFPCASYPWLYLVSGEEGGSNKGEIRRVKRSRRARVHPQWPSYTTRISFDACARTRR